MTVRKLRNSWWVDFRFNFVRYRMRSPDNTRAGADAFEALLRQRLVRGEPVRCDRVPMPEKRFGEFADEWFRLYVMPNNKYSEQKTKQTILRCHLVPAFGKLPLNDISAERVERYKSRKVADGLSPKTVNNQMMVLARCLRSAVEWGLIDKMPRFQWLKTSSHRLDFLSYEEARLLLSYDREPMWRDMILLALRTGLRRGELMALHWDDIDLERRLLTVRRSLVLGRFGTPKSNRERYVPLSAEVCAMLAARSSAPSLVFHKPGGRHLSREMMDNALPRACRRVGIRPVGWHLLRHTFASHLATEGVSLRVIQELLGHASITTTMRYAHLAPSALREAVDVLERCQQQRTPNRGQPVGNIGALAVPEESPALEPNVSFPLYIAKSIR